MHEEEFRRRLHDAIGKPPPLAEPVLGPSKARAPRSYAGAMGLVAAVMAGLLVVVLLSTRGLLPSRNAGPAPLPSSQAGSFPCALPVSLIVESGNPGQDPVMATSYGFVNIPTGTLRIDPNARVSDLPAAPGMPPALYSAQLHRWVPATARSISPDGIAYAYTKLPTGQTYSNFTSSELHIYNVSTKTDRTLWTDADGIEVLAWDLNGIVASTVPREGGLQHLWRVDPSSGSVSALPASADTPFLPPSIQPEGGNYSYMGADSQGRAVFRLGSRDAGVKYRVVVVQSGRLIATIYSGTAGDAKDFDPGGIFFDVHGVWFSNFDGKVVWLWAQSSGLQSFKVSGLPPTPSGYAHTDFSFFPAGACVPGEFTGVAASPLPAAATPSPSPVPSPVDWSVLTRRPLTLQPLAAGAACPVSPESQLAVKPQSGKWPTYGFGQPPAYLSGQFTWYSAGSQGVVILIDPQYTGPLLVRSRRLDGGGTLAFSGQPSTALAGGALGIGQTSAPPYWGTWFGVLIPSAPGCYGIQFDGSTFTSVTVISVSKGPPPPG